MQVMFFARSQIMSQFIIIKDINSAQLILLNVGLLFRIRHCNNTETTHAAAVLNVDCYIV